jgi:hypothetical protein
VCAAARAPVADSFPTHPTPKAVRRRPAPERAGA